MPNKRVYSINIFWVFPQTYLLIYLALLVLIFHSTRLFGPLVLFFYEIYSKYPPYSFIWPYLFNWHLRVVKELYIIQATCKLQNLKIATWNCLICKMSKAKLMQIFFNLRSAKVAKIANHSNVEHSNFLLLWKSGRAE